MDIAIEISIAMAAGEVPTPGALETAIDIDVIAGVVPERASDIASEPAMDIDIDSFAADTRHVLAPIPMPRPRPMSRPLAPVRSPAERLGLHAEARVQAEDCLARAIYFEARGESVRGQIGIAQVIMNRVFSRYYPDEICGVVYQDRIGAMPASSPSPATASPKRSRTGPRGRLPGTPQGWRSAAGSGTRRSAGRHTTTLCGFSPGGSIRCESSRPTAFTSSIGRSGGAMAPTNRTGAEWPPVP